MHETNILGSCTRDGLFICIADWLNLITGGAFWTMFCVAFMVVVFMATTRYGTPRAFAYSGTSGVFAALLFTTAGLMVWGITAIFIIVYLISLAAIYLSRRSD